MTPAEFVVLTETAMPTRLPMQTATITPVPTDTPVVLLSNYKFPIWVAETEIPVLMMVSDVTEISNELTFLNANTHKEFSISLPSESFSRFFWMPDGLAFGLLSSDLLSVTLISIATGEVTTHLLHGQAMLCFDDYAKETLPIMRPGIVFSEAPEDQDFFCPKGINEFKAYQEQDKSKIIIRNIGTEQTRQVIGNPSSELVVISSSWSESSGLLAILLSQEPDPDNFNPNVAQILIYDVGSQQVIATYTGEYCEISWAPDGTKALAYDDGCFANASPYILYPYEQKIEAVAISEKEGHYSNQIAPVEWLRNGEGFYHIFPNSNRMDLCQYNISTNSVYCPTESFDELDGYNVEYYEVSPDEEVIVFSYGASCYGCDFWGDPSSALIRADGTDFFFIAEEVADWLELNHPYPYYTMLWKPMP